LAIFCFLTGEQNEDPEKRRTLKNKTFFMHEKAIVESKSIGLGTRIWAFSHILPGAVIGSGCNICDHTFIENDVIVGDRVTIKNGVQLWDGIRIEDDVFIGPNATFANDLLPRNKRSPEKFEITKVRRGASIGASATIFAGIVIGQYAMVGAGAVVTNNVPPHAIVVGNPARIMGYDRSISNKERGTVQDAIRRSTHEVPCSTSGVKVIAFTQVIDLRGNLSAIEKKDIPFTPKRFFWVYDVPNKEIRGEHAHKTQEQFLVCVKGSVMVLVDDGHNRDEFLLDKPNLGLYIPPMLWAAEYKYSPDAVLLVFASDVYDPDDYIRNYDEFLRMTAKNDH
jgi:UDP-2-acetamido-3-amino-2,3-dideoxy-glucuronate N-acetyltransferase